MATEIIKDMGHDGLTVGDLINALQKIDRKAKIVIGDKVVQGVATVTGRIRDDGYFGPSFTEVAPPKARDVAVTFVCLAELSDGSVTMQRIY